MKPVIESIVRCDYQGQACHGIEIDYSHYDNNGDFILKPMGYPWNTEEFKPIALGENVHHQWNTSAKMIIGIICMIIEPQQCNP